MKITKETSDEISVNVGSQTYRYWIWGVGLIPLHKNPCLYDDILVRRFLKKHLFGQRHGVLE